MEKGELDRDLKALAQRKTPPDTKSEKLFFIFGFLKKYLQEFLK